MGESVYIASDHPLPLIEWDEDNPYFRVTELIDDNEGVRRLFTKHYVYRVCSQIGHGGAFMYMPDRIEEQYPGHSEEIYRKVHQRTREYYSSEEEYQRIL